MPERDYLRRLAERRYDGELRNRWLESVQRLAQGMDISEVERRIRRGDLEGAIRSIGIMEHDFDEFRTAMLGAMGAAGNETMQGIVALRRTEIAFNPGNRAAVQRINSLHARLIRETTESTREAILDTIRDGLERGHNPRTVARMIRGRYDYQAKAFRGGVIGLTRAQAGFVRNARNELLSGDPAQMRRYLTRKLRDRRYDRSIIKAINEGVPPPARIRENAIAAYERKYISHRAETIARDQSLEALTQGQEAALDQAVEERAIRDQDILRHWVTAGDERVRDKHSEIPAMNAKGVRRNEMFMTPAGPMKRPRDRNSPGGTPGNTIQCRCVTSIKVRRQ